MSETPPPTQTPGDKPNGPHALPAPGLSLLDGEGYSAMRRRKRARLSTMVAWGLIVLAAGLIARGHVVGGRAAQLGGPSEPRASDQAAVELVARALVGIKAWGERAGAAEQLQGQIGPAARQQVDPLATPAGDLVRAATLAGELDRAETALDLLDVAEAQFEGATKAASARELLAEVFRLQEAIAPGGGAQGAVEELAARRAALRELHATPPPDGEAADDSSYAQGQLRDVAMLRRIYLDGGPGDVHADEQARLIERHGFFGRLALSFGQGEDTPDRDFVLAKAGFTLRVMIGAVAVIVTALLSGLVLFVAALVLVNKGRVKLRLAWQVRELRPHGHLFVETMAVFLIGFIVVAELAGLLQGVTGVDLSQVVIWLLLPIALWPMVRGVGPRELRMGLGWHANGGGGAGVAKEALCGVVGYLAGLPILLVGFLLTFLLLLIPGAHSQHPATQEIDASLRGYLQLLLLASIWAPLVEETMFRGALMTHARLWAPALWSAGLTGFLFAAIHPQGWAAIPALMSLGVIFALIREWRGSLIGSITVHALHNGFLMTMLTLGVS